MHVVVIGGANLDTITRTSASAVLHTSNPGRAHRSPGGVGRNIAENLARLGVDLTFITAYADDPAGEVVASSLTGLPITTLRVGSPTSTGSYTAVLGADGDLVIAVADMQAIDSIGAADVATQWLGDASWVVLDGNLGVGVLGACLEAAAEVGASVLLDPVSVAKATRLRALPRLPVHTFTPNHDELLAFADTDSLEVALDRAYAAGAERVWIREGAAGSLLACRDHPSVQIPVDHTDQVADVTGAGDAMLAAYLHRLLLGDAPARAAAFGATAARLTVEVEGAVNPRLTPDLLATTHEERR